MINSELNRNFLDFLDRSPTPFHAVENLGDLFTASGFVKLNENDTWELERGQAYYVVRAGSSIVAFVYGEEGLESGIRALGAHTDSPCLKLKPQPEWHQYGYQQFGIEVYGGVLLNPWFDRDLSLAGEVSWLDTQNTLCKSLINLEKPIASIPSLAIHLDREVNAGRAVNPETQMKPLWQMTETKQDFREYLCNKLRADGHQVKRVLDFNLSFYDTQNASLIGENEEFISGARLDNLLSCYVGALALCGAGRQYTNLLVCNDHEEVGSRSDIGAQGTFLEDVFLRLTEDDKPSVRQKMLRKSWLLSIDNAHGIHPNFAAKHDKNHGPILNQGPVLKFNANQAYATASDSAALIRYLASFPGQEEIPLQAFSMRADMACGSTIGPITATKMGLRTLDLGVPTFGMHSIRELAGAADTGYLQTLVARFLARLDQNSSTY